MFHNSVPGLVAALELLASSALENDDLDLQDCARGVAQTLGLRVQATDQSCRVSVVFHFFLEDKV